MNSPPFLACQFRDNCICCRHIAMKCDDVYYWAPSGRSEIEVDFLLVRGANLIAVEAKSGNTFRDAWCKGLRAVAKLEGLKRRIVVYPDGPVMKTQDDIDAMLFRRFADELASDTLWR